MKGIQMNIAYIIALTDTNLLTSESSGIKKKIDWQVSALNRAGVETHIIKKEILPKVKRAFPFHSSIIDWYGLLEDMVQKYDGMYHRHVYTDYHMLSFFKKLKKIKPDFKIILELPTYPYDQERRKNLLYYRDLIYRKYLYKYVDRIVIFDKKKTVWGIPAIQTHNGIDIHSLNIKRQKQRNDGLDICMVGDFEYWHGVDRLLQGFFDYYEDDGTEDIRIHLVGGVSNAQKVEEYRQLASKGLIKDRVFFYGNLVGEELDHVYDICHLAVASLGRHRTGVMISSEIKTREYMAKGIPFIYSTEIDVFRDAHEDFALQISIDDQPVKMKDVLNFYNGLVDKYQCDELSNRIRKFAEDTVSIDQVMKPVADYYLMMEE